MSSPVFDLLPPPPKKQASVFNLPPPPPRKQAVEADLSQVTQGQQIPSAVDISGREQNSYTPNLLDNRRPSNIPEMPEQLITGTRPTIPAIQQPPISEQEVANYRRVTGPPPSISEPTTVDRQGGAGVVGEAFMGKYASLNPLAWLIKTTIEGTKATIQEAKKIPSAANSQFAIPGQPFTADQILGSLATVLKGGFTAGTLIQPELAAFTLGSGLVAETGKTGEATLKAMTPLQNMDPKTYAAQKLAEIGDIVLQGAIAMGGHAISGAKAAVLKRLGEKLKRGEAPTKVEQSIINANLSPEYKAQIEDLANRQENVRESGTQGPTPILEPGAPKTPAEPSSIIGPQGEALPSARERSAQAGLTTAEREAFPLAPPPPKPQAAGTIVQPEGITGTETYKPEVSPKPDLNADISTRMREGQSPEIQPKKNVELPPEAGAPVAETVQPKPPVVPGATAAEQPQALPEFKSSEEAIAYGRKNPTRVSELEARAKESDAKARELLTAKNYQAAQQEALRSQLAHEAIEFSKDPNLQTPWEKSNNLPAGSEKPGKRISQDEINQMFEKKAQEDKAATPQKQPWEMTKEEYLSKRPQETAKPLQRADEYHGEHEAPLSDSGSPLWDLTRNDIYPKDVYGSNGRQYYAGTEPGDAEAFSIASAYQNKPNRSITVFRAVPKDLKGTGEKLIRPGDWITITRGYAAEHGRSNLNGEYRIVSKIVKARDIFTEGNSLQEWGYDPQPENVAARHRTFVSRALSEGKPVPPEVLKDYPELVKKESVSPPVSPKAEKHIVAARSRLIDQPLIFTPADLGLPDVPIQKAVLVVKSELGPERYKSALEDFTKEREHLYGEYGTNAIMDKAGDVEEFTKALYEEILKKETPPVSPKAEGEKGTPSRDELKTKPGVYWHGTASGDLRGGKTGLHIGTYEAAKQALNATIGVPAEGEWDGTREYGKALLAGQKTLKKIDPQGFNVTGFNVGSSKERIPIEDYYAADRKEKATYSNRQEIPPTVKPEIFPVRIKGEMSNTPQSPHPDWKANGYMSGQLKKGTAKRGFFYKNEGEDAGSISATVPNAQHIERIETQPTAVKSSPPSLPEGKGEWQKGSVDVPLGNNTYKLSGETYGDYILHKAVQKSGEKKGWMLTRISDGETVSGTRSWENPDQLRSLAKELTEKSVSPSPEGKGKETPEPLTPSKLQEAAQAAPKAGNTFKEQKNILLDQLESAKKVADTFEKDYERLEKSQEPIVERNTNQMQNELDQLDSRKPAKPTSEQDAAYWKERNEITDRYGKIADKRKRKLEAERKVIDDKRIAAAKDAGFTLDDKGRVVIDVPGDGTFSTPLGRLQEGIDRISKQWPKNVGVAEPPSGPKSVSDISKKTYKDDYFSIPNSDYQVIGGKVIYRGEPPKGLQLNDLAPDAAATKKRSDELFNAQGETAKLTGFAMSDKDFGGAGFSIKQIPDETRGAALDSAPRAIFEANGKYYELQQRFYNTLEQRVGKADEYRIDPKNKSIQAIKDGEVKAIGMLYGQGKEGVKGKEVQRVGLTRDEMVDRWGPQFDNLINRTFGKESSPQLKKTEETRKTGTGGKPLLSIAAGAAYASVDSLPVDDETKKKLKAVLGAATLLGIGSIAFATTKIGKAEKELVVLHNLTEKNIRFADKLGGLAMPSLAITKKSIPFEGFGEVSLLAKPDLIDPRVSRRNIVADADQYSPRYPSITYEVSDNLAKAYHAKALEAFKSKYKTEDIPEYRRSSDTQHYGLKEGIADEGTRGLEGNLLVMSDFIKNELGQELPDASKYSSVDSALRTVVEGHRKEFERYLETVVDDVSKRGKLFKGFTDAGYRRYQDYTLDNVMRQMKSEMAEGEGFHYGAGSVRSKAAKRFSSLSDIRSESDKLVPEKEMEAAKEEMNNRLVALAQENLSNYKYDRNHFGAIEEFSKALMEGSRVGNVERILKEYGFENPDMEPIKAFLTDLRDMPSEYFEAKPVRAVGLGEFSAAVAPKDLSAETRSILEKNGIQIEQYDKAIPGDRQKAIERATSKNPNLLFSLGSLAASQAVDFTNLSDDDKKRAKILFGTLGVLGLSLGALSMKSKGALEEIQSSIAKKNLSGRAATEALASDVKTYLETEGKSLPETERTEISKLTDPQKLTEVISKSEQERTVTPEKMAEVEKVGKEVEKSLPKEPKTEQVDQPLSSATGIANAIVNAEREGRGLQALDTEGKRTWGNVWEEAKTAIKNGRDPRQLAQELSDKPRPVTDTESAMLDYDRVSLRNEHREVMDNILKATQSGDEAVLLESRARLAAIEDNINDNDLASRRVGTDVARSLAIRAMMVKEDYSLSNLIQRAKVANQGKDITPELRKKLETLSKQLEAANAKNEVYARKIESLKNPKPPKEPKAPLTPEQIADRKLRGYKTRLHNQQQYYEEQLKSQIFQKKGKPKPIELDPEAMRLKANVEMLKHDLDMQIRILEHAHRTGYEKGLDWFTKWRRAVLLSGMKTLGKLTSAATMRQITTPIEELVGGLLSKIPVISKISDMAPREGGGINVNAEAKALRQWVEKATRDDVRTMLRTGKSSLDFLYGKKGHLPPEALDVFGHIHGALKVEPKRAEFYRSFEKMSAFAMKQGLDVTDPRVQASIAAKSYIEANRAIFMNDNAITTAYRMLLGYMRKTGPGGKGLAAFGQILFPIVKVPTNFINESLSYGLGGLRALGQVIASKGIENLTPVEADYVMRALKKQSIGLAMMAIGYYSPNAIGGYYQPGEKRKPQDLKAGDVKLFGLSLPHFMLHTPAIEVLQLGATLRRVQDAYANKMEEGGTAAGIQAGLKGLAEQVPFFEEPLRLGEAFKSSEAMKKFAGQSVASLIIPPDVQSSTKFFDRHGYKFLQGEPINRKATGFVENIEAVTPGLRQNVPEVKKSNAELSSSYVEKFKAIRGMTEAERKNLKPEDRPTSEELQAAIRSGYLSKSNGFIAPTQKLKDAVSLTKREQHFKQLPLEQQWEKYQKLEPEEKAKVRQTLLLKSLNSKNADPNLKREIWDGLRKEKTQ